MILSLIAAYAKDKDGARVIGKGNQMPWHFPHDLERFKEYTTGSPVIMGRKTHESIGRILPKRDNIIVTRQKDYHVPHAFVFDDLEQAIDFASSRASEIFIIGGADIYAQTIDRADRLYLTSFKIDDVEGDSFFPDYNKNLFKLIYQERAQISGDCFRILDRKVPQPQEAAAETTATASAPEITGMHQVDNPEDLDYIWGGYIV